MDKNTILANAVKSVLDEKGWSVEYIKTDTPRDLWKWVSEKLPDNVPFGTTSTNISNYMTRNDGKQKKAVLSIVRSLYAGYVEDSPQQTQLDQCSQQLTIDDVRRIVSEELDRRFTDVEQLIHNEHNRVELCPDAPIGEGKERKREYMRFSVTVDKNLWKLFRHEQKSLNVTAPRMLDSILWERYGKPKLSFEE